MTREMNEKIDQATGYICLTCIILLVLCGLVYMVQFLVGLLTFISMGG